MLLVILYLTVYPLTLASFSYRFFHSSATESMVLPAARAGATISAQAGSELKESVAPHPAQMWLAAPVTTSLNASESAQYPLATCASNHSLAVDWYAGRPVMSLTDCGPLVAYCRNLPTASRFFEWLDPYQKPPPTLPVLTSSPAQCNGAPAAHVPGAAARLSGFWMTPSMNQVGPGMPSTVSLWFAAQSGVNRPSSVRVLFLNMWSRR